MNSLKDKTDDELVKWAEDTKKVDDAHLEMLRRFNKSTKRYSKILAVVAFAQLIVVISQLIFTAVTNQEYIWYGVIVVILTMTLIGYLFRQIDKNL